MTKVDVNAGGSSKPELSRREREELEKQRAQANYQKLHAEGKTDQARADLARLAIIKQHRAEAAARREAEKKGKRDFQNYVIWERQWFSSLEIGDWNLEDPKIAVYN